MVQHACLSCRHAYTDLKATTLPPAASRPCPRCGRPHVMVSRVSRPRPTAAGLTGR